MNTKIKASIFCIAAAVLSLTLGGCSDEKGGSTIDIYSGSTSVSSEGSVNSSLTTIEPMESSVPDASGTFDTSDAPIGEPTTLVGLDGKPIYTSEITEVYDIKGEPTTVDQITPDNDGMEIICDGFQYFKEPSGMAYDNYNNPELFDDMEFIGEMPENKNGFRRVNVGDEICGLTLVNAAAEFLISPGDYDIYKSYYCHEQKFSREYTAEFEGTVTIEGFMNSAARNSYEPYGGALRFTPVENKLPIIGDYFGQETGFAITATFDSFELLSLNESGMIMIDEHNCDLGGLGIGDIMYVRATLSNIKYDGIYVIADLEDMEILSDVLIHVEDTI